MKSIKRLPTNVMHALGETLLNLQRDTVRASAVTGGMLPALVKAQGDLVAALETQQVSEELQAVGEALMAADERHDRLVGLIHGGLTVGIELAELRGDAADARLLSACLATLLPDGRSQRNKPLHEEAGDAPAFAARLTPDHEARLRALPVAGALALELVHEWVAAARTLGALLAQRAELSAGLEAVVSLNDVRAPWGHAFAAFLTALPFSGLSDEDQRRLREPFEEAVRMHTDRIGRRSQSQAAQSPSPAPTATADPAPLGI